jgi:hypothetical protein
MMRARHGAFALASSPDCLDLIIGPIIGVALVFTSDAPNVVSVAEPDQHKERRHGIPPQIDG